VAGSFGAGVVTNSTFSVSAGLALTFSDGSNDAAAFSAPATIIGSVGAKYGVGDNDAFRTSWTSFTVSAGVALSFGDGSADAASFTNGTTIKIGGSFKAIYGNGSGDHTSVGKASFSVGAGPTLATAAARAA